MNMISARGYPLATLSIIKYAPEVEQAKLDRKAAEDNRGHEVFATIHGGDWRGRSYRKHFTPLVTEDEPEVVDIWLSQGYLHDPYTIDNPQGAHEGRETADSRHPDRYSSCYLILLRHRNIHSSPVAFAYSTEDQ